MIALEKLRFGNGAGSIKRPDQVRQACKSPMTHIVVGSITMEQREGNSGETYYFHPQEQWSLNSLGLPNAGIKKYAEEALPYMAHHAHANRKELWASVAGFSPKEYADMAAACFAAGVDGVELNLSCPNVWSGSEHAQMPALIPTLAWEVIFAVALKCGEEQQIAVKLSPTDRLDLLEELVDVIKSSQIVTHVTACNAVPNQRGRRVDGKQALAFYSDAEDKELKHRGGLAGTGCMETNLQTVKTLRKLLPARINLTGCGGIFTGTDACRYVKAGADGFQCTTSYLEYRDQVFVDILMQLELTN